MGGATLVDPYLELIGLIDLGDRTEVHQVLVGNSSGSHKGKRAAMAQYLKSATGATLDVRVSSDLHDRMVVADDGRVWTLGMSLNGIHRRKSITVLTPMPASAAATLAAEVQELWNGSTSIHGNEEDKAGGI